MRTTGQGTQSARSRWRSVATAVAAFVLLVVVWELVKLVVPADGVSIGGTRVLPRTSDASMPHVWTVLGRLFDPEVAGAAQQRSIGAAVLSARCSHCASRSAACCSAVCSACCWPC